MITYHGLLSIARGGHFGGGPQNWWEDNKLGSSLFQLSGHQVFHIVSLTGPPRASDISEARSLIAVTSPPGPATTGGHPTWTNISFTNTPNALFREGAVELLGGGVRLNLFGIVDDGSGGDIGLSDVTSLSTTPAAVSMVTSLNSGTFHFEANTDATSLFHGWFNANQAADDPGVTPGPSGFDMYNRSADRPDIVFATAIYSPGLEMIRYDDVNVGDYKVNFFTKPGGFTLTSSISNDLST